MSWNYGKKDKRHISSKNGFDDPGMRKLNVGDVKNRAAALLPKLRKTCANIYDGRDRSLDS